MSDNGKTKTCLIRGCTMPAKSRGLCPTCRAAARAAVSRGDTTEEQLIALGLLLPAKNGGRPMASRFSVELRRKLETR